MMKDKKYFDENIYGSIMINNVSQDKIAIRDYHYRVRVGKYIESLISYKQSFMKQYLPDVRELEDDFGLLDPLNEQDDSPLKNVIHRYNNRIAIYLTNSCAAFCRFCLRKRKIGLKDYIISKDQLLSVLEYLQMNKGIREVLLTGGDPLTLEDQFLDEIISGIKNLPHIKVLRICSRMPVQNPNRITSELCSIIEKAKPVYFMLHINHPEEITSESQEAIKKIQQAGILILSQSVLLKGINDNVETLESLFNKLIEIGIKPYHLYQANRVLGASHFIVPIDESIKLVNRLWGNLSGIAMPLFVYNSENGKGKIPLAPSAIYLSEDDKEIKFLSYNGEIAKYPKK